MNILIIGPSGSGKSTIGRLLHKRGYNFVEADTDKFDGTNIAYFRDKKTGKGVDMPWPRPDDWAKANDWVWRIGILKKLLARWPEEVNFVCGESYNKREAYPLFDKIIALTTDNKTLRQRVLARQDNYFGKNLKQFAWVIEQNR